MIDAKKPLVSGRLAKRLAQHGLDSFGDYYRMVSHDAKERQMAVDLLTTNETFFFREPKHSSLADTIVPEMARPAARLERACSSGRRSLHLAMTLAHALGQRVSEILASRHQHPAGHGTRGCTQSEDAQDIPKAYRTVLPQGIGSQDGWFTVDKGLRSAFSSSRST